VLISQARRGRRIVRLKGGDPFVFGRGGEEALALEEAGIPYAIVPGVSSGVAAPAAAGIPITHRGLAASVTFATATRADGDVDWAHLAGAQTLVLFMAAGRLVDVSARLLAAGKPGDTPAAAIARATLPDEQVVVATLATLAEAAARAALATPALIVLGPTVALRARLAGLRSFTSSTDVADAAAGSIV
jgi:uroporphyrin-III C-methyltransferase